MGYRLHHRRAANEIRARVLFGHCGVAFAYTAYGQPFGKSLRVPRVALSPRPCRSQHTVRDAPSGESSECETGDARTVRYIFYYYCDHTTQHTLKLDLEFTALQLMPICNRRGTDHL